MVAVAELVTQRYLSAAFRQAHPDRVALLHAQLLSQDPEAYAASCQAVADVDWLNGLHRIACPTLVLAGALDLGATPAMAQQIQTRIAAAQLEIFENPSHLSPLEEPESVERAVQVFLGRLDAG
jgi:3-oxoadipate enol-lactonase